MWHQSAGSGSAKSAETMQQSELTERIETDVEGAAGVARDKAVVI